MTIAVIGAGLIGSAAARHLAGAGHRVTLIGPVEPADKRAHRGVFASHYDEGRITRRNDADPFWAEVSAASIARYAEIEAAGGRFFAEVGGLIAGRADSGFMADVAAVAACLGSGSIALDSDGLARAFPYFRLPPRFAGHHERQGAGHISPRRLVAAQIRAARALGVTYRAAAVQAVDERPGGVRIKIANAEDLVAERVLIAAGAMTEAVLGACLGLCVYARTVALFRVAEAEAARLGAMPSAIFRLPGPGHPYLLPPIRYPDGHWYLKLGGDPVDVALPDAAAIGDWFRSGGDPAVRDHLAGIMGDLMPDLAVEAVTMDACVTTFSTSGYPVIDRVTNRIAVATAGNGAGAKCSDELGRLGALAVSGGAIRQETEQRVAKAS